jgi:hypothetical protein
MRHFPLATASLLLAMLSSGCAEFRRDGASLKEAEDFHAALVTAFNTCDERRFVDAYAPRFSFTTSHTSRSITAPDGLRRYLAYGCQQSPSPQVTLVSQAIRREGGVAIVVGQYEFRRVIDGRLGNETQNYTLILAQERGTWRITAHHVSLVP